MAALKIVAWNCSGLRADSPTTPAKMSFLETQYPQSAFDILTLLETHHRHDQDFPSLLQSYAITHHLIDTPADPRDHFGGIVVLIRKSFTILTSDIFIPGRILTLTIQHTISLQQFTLTAYYGLWFNTSSQIKPYFDALTSHHSPHTNSFIIGDINFVSSDLDRKNGMNRIDNSVQPKWQALENSLNIVDPFRYFYPTKRIYSYFSKDKKPNSRIDRMYVSEQTLQHVNSYTYITTPFFDHKIQDITYRLDIPFGKGLWKMNISVLPDKKYQELITALISNMDTLPVPDKRTWWEVFLLSVRSYTIQYSKDKHYDKNKLKNTIIQQLDIVHAMDPTFITPTLQNRIDYLQEQLKKLQLDEVEGYIVRSRLPKFEDKEPKIEYYSKLEKRTAKANMISILHDANSKECKDYTDLLKITHDFYSDLYRPTYTDPHMQYTLLQKIDTHLSPTQTQSLDSPITLPELTKAVHQLPRDKTPGRDGLPIEFYHTFWEHIRLPYLAYINEAYIHGFKESRNKGLIKIIYKDKGDPKDLQNYRPISLLNCDLKILTKTLANRLKIVLPTIIHKTQTAIDGRKIDYTIHMLRDLIQLAENENLAAGFIFLDQEKAFDRVDHDFLFAVMKKYKFGHIFITWLKQLYKNATTTILVNGYETGSIPLIRDVRLAPFCMFW